LLQLELEDQKIDMERAIEGCSEINGDGADGKTFLAILSVRCFDVL
jgi:hypothetical protein